MMKIGYLKPGLLLVAALALIALDANDASATWRGRGGCYGSAGCYGCYGSCYASYGSCYASYGSASCYGSAGCYASYGSGGCHGGLAARRQARREARRAARACYGCYGCAGSYGTSYVAYSSVGSYGSYGSASVGTSYYDSFEYATPVDDCGCTGEPAAEPAVEASAEPDLAAIDSGDATLRVTVPADAQVFVNGNATTSTGPHRDYVSHDLRPGMSYAYEIRVEFDQLGKTVTQEKTVRLRAGQVAAVDFGADAEAVAAETPAPVNTVLKLQVPEDAEVFLAGESTRQTGSVRTYTTSQLKSGEKWSDYAVRVEWEVDGQKLVEERVLQIEAGETCELAVDFEDARMSQLAQAR